MNLLRVPFPLPLDLPFVSPPLLFLRFSICISAVSSFLVSLESSLSLGPPLCTPERAVYVELSYGADGNRQSIKSKKGLVQSRLEANVSREHAVLVARHTVPAKVCGTEPQFLVSWKRLIHIDFGVAGQRSIAHASKQHLSPHVGRCKRHNSYHVKRERPAHQSAGQMIQNFDRQALETPRSVGGPCFVGRDLVQLYTPRGAILLTQILQRLGLDRSVREINHPV